MPDAIATAATTSHLTTLATPADVAVALRAAADDPGCGFALCPRCGQLSAFRDAGELVCLDCTPVAPAPGGTASPT